LEDDVLVGPFAHLRPGAHVGSGSRIGNFAEVKQSRLGPGVQQHHFSYVGDADVGSGVNIGAGTVTANYDGARKNRTVIGEGAFIGSDSMLVAPVEIGAGAVTAAGSVVTHDVPAGKVAVGVPARIRDPKPKTDAEEGETR
jgi:bifunctional UDP-N-acetylglucosamine pyrophosphorylase/glucosamine-1-phosphate N-acetyltransferase